MHDSTSDGRLALPVSVTAADRRGATGTSRRGAVGRERRGVWGGSYRPTAMALRLAVELLLLTLGACVVGRSTVEAAPPPATEAVSEVEVTGAVETALPTAADLASAVTSTADTVLPPPAEAAIAATSDWLPADALALLAQSLRDSCAICAEKNRTKAFSLLDRALLPQTLVASTQDLRFLLVPGGENELALSTHPGDRPTVTLRFHTRETHLVGIAERDWTDDGVAAVVLPAVSGSGTVADPGADAASDPDSAWVATGGPSFEGMLEVVAYAYGDGASFLWLQAQGRLQIQCRILEIAPEIVHE